MMKRKISELALSRQSQAKRHKAWLGRHDISVKPAAWRPLQYYRNSAKHWPSNLDNQYRLLSGGPGLRFFQPAEDEERWRNWRTWPFWVIGVDLGSDGVSGLHVGQYKFSLCLEGLSGPSHGAARDVDGAIKAVGLFPLALLMVVSFNLPFGPMREDFRYVQLKAHMANCFQRNGPGTSPLYQSLSAPLAEACKAMGYQFSNDRPLDDQVWELLSQRAHFVRQGRRCTMCRFQALTTTMGDRLPWWAIELPTARSRRTT